VDQRLARKEFIYQGYRERFSGVSSIGFMPEPEYGKGNYWLSNISIDNGAVTAIEQFVMALRSARIEASTMWRPMALQGVNDGLRRFGGTASQEIFRTFLSLPSGSALSGQDLDRVADTVKEQLQVAT
jgi:dTDP-4-amino-4,6-dideoxygalactose transaminase